MKPQFTLISLGCPKNMVDSENLVGRLIEAGYEFLPISDDCDFVILNTCGFLKSARNEARNFFDELIELKNAGRIKRIFVTGCLVDFEKDAPLDEFPEIDAWISIGEEPRIVEIVQNFFPSSESKSETAANENSNRLYLIPHEKRVQNVLDDKPRYLLTPDHIAYLRIADGCNRFCTYCAIPAIRGAFVSKPQELILEEAQKLIESGTKELVLIAQETTFWGTDLYGEPRLASLLDALRKLPGDFWVRLMYTYPLHFTDELIAIFAEESGNKNPKILPYIDLPLQHCNDMILKRMNRQVDADETEKLLEKLRLRIGNLVLRTSLIVGFPGETDDIFQDLMDFVDRWRFERGGVFAFSPEPGTSAAKFDDQVPEDIVHHRFELLSQKMESLRIEKDEKRVGTQCDILIDQPVLAPGGKPLDTVFWGRSYAEAPDVDYSIVVNGENLTSGQRVPCEIIQIQNGPLIAAAITDEKS